jgi:malonyl-CoA O-methyltransferase
MKLAKNQIARQFSRAAATYDHAAQLQNRMASQLIEMIPANVHGSLVDLGCGTGWALEKIHQLNRFELIAIDLAPGMLEVAQSRVPSATFHCCDLEETPLPNESADLVFSNAAIQWCDLGGALTEMKRLCRRGGTILFSTFGSDTLADLRSAWQTSGDTQDRVHRFDSFSNMESTAKAMKFENFQLSASYRELKFDSVDSLLQNLKQLGATNASTTRQPGLLGTSRYRAFRDVLAQRLADDGQLTLTFECVFGLAVK